MPCPVGRGEVPNTQNTLRTNFFYQLEIGDNVLLWKPLTGQGRDKVNNAERTCPLRRF